MAFLTLLPNRYLPVKDAVVFGNSFINCTPFSLCEGSDKERSQVPQNVLIANNVFYNKKDTTLFYKFDDISGFAFENNVVSKSIKQDLPNGLNKDNLQDNKINEIVIKAGKPSQGENKIDALQNKAKQKLGVELNNNIGFGKYNLPKSLSAIQQTTGITWKEEIKQPAKTIEVQCANTKQLLALLSDSINYKKKINIALTGIIYGIKSPYKNLQSSEFCHQ